MLRQRLFSIFVTLSAAGAVHAQETELPEGPGKDQLVRTCTQCHSIEQIVRRGRTEQEWADVITRMIAQGAVVTDAQFQPILTYLSTQFGMQYKTAASPVQQQSPQPVTPSLPHIGPRTVQPTAAQAPGCCAPAREDFPKVGGNLGNQSYSSLAQINQKNIARLGAAWRVNLEPGAAPMPQQSSVVASHGVLFVETTQGKVFAVDGRTGAVKWSYAPPYGSSLRRGVAVGEGLVFTNAAGRRVIALNQDTGEVVWEKVLAEPSISSRMKVAVTYYDGMLYVGSDDGSRGAAFAMRADTGDVVWKFYGTPGPGEFGHDTWEGDSWQVGGADPWMNPAIDPQLGLVYWTFGNAKAGGDPADGTHVDTNVADVPPRGVTAVDGSTRGGLNLFANSLVALDLKTGKRRWHFQSVHHDIWDMDNVMAPVLADVRIKGALRKAVIYGSKTGLTYILDRVDGGPLIGIEERAVPQEPTQKTWPTQPYPNGDPIVPLCADANAKDATRAPPNYAVGCLFTPHAQFPVVISPGTGGGADWSQQSFSPKTGLLYVGAGVVNSAHSVPTGGVGFRPAGEGRSGKLVAKDPKTNKIVWERAMPWSLAHGNGILSTAGDVFFVGQPDGFLLGLDIANGRELWRFQTGAGVHTSPITYSVDGVQYVAVFAGGNGLPYNSPQGDYLWAFRIGGTVAPAPTPPPPLARQPVAATPVAGAVANYTVTLARTWSISTSSPGTGESSSPNAMAPQVMSVPMGATVTFKNPADNSQPHCASQFFEGLFNIGPLQPGESASYTFTAAGEYFYNDCTFPQVTGKILVQ
jgi:PQQ-dependent dehydrogenase (methanol/ethanol family)